MSFRRDWNAERREKARQRDDLIGGYEQTPPCGASMALKAKNRRDEIRRKAEERAKAIRAAQEEQNGS